MRRGLLATSVLLGLALPAHGQTAPKSEAEFAEAIQGCWSRTSWDAETEAKRADPKFFVSGQMCFEGGLSGDVTYFNCSGVGMDCWNAEAKYELRDMKLWHDHGDNISGGRIDKCDIALEGGRWLTLSNCEWVDADAGVKPVEDIVYERIVDL